MYTAIPRLPSRQEALSCITFFDSGSININPIEIEYILALSSGNSIYITSKALSNPTKPIVNYKIRHIIGNIGPKGILLLVAPQNPRIRVLGNNYRLVKHEPYDHKRENNFRDTTLHLLFTDWA